MITQAMNKFGKKFNFFDMIGNLFTSNVGLICTIGAHVAANALLPGIGSAIVLGV